MDNTDLKKIHDVELEILGEVHKFCIKHKIRYSLYCGTMLGAVRHGGFIPWDDDIDICMLRDDYNRFIKLWTESNNQDYIIQNKENQALFTQSFTKIRKNHTTFLQPYDIAGQYHTGIFIDILPLDRIPEDKISKLLFKWNLMNYLLFTREHVDARSNKLIRFFSSCLLRINNPTTRKQKRNKYLKKITQYNNNKRLKLVSANTLDGLRHEMPDDLPKQYQMIKFESSEFMCYSDCDGLLSAWYGDYMKLPPEEQRVWRHHPVLVDFEHNSDEIDIHS